MGNSLRCCLACFLPCGALDLILIVHLNGFVEEMSGPVTAGEVLNNNPNHVLSKPCSQGVVHRILILSPESELKRGSIYFLMPDSSVPEKKRSHRNPKNSSKKTTTHQPNSHARCSPPEKKPSRRYRHTGRSGVWRPHLQSISEDQ